MEEPQEEKRADIMEKPQEEEAENSPDEWVGPMPSEATEPQAKKRKVLQYEKLFLDK